MEISKKPSFIRSENVQLLSLSILSGFLFFLALPGFDLWPLAFIAFVPWLYVLEQTQDQKKLALAYSFLFGFIGNYGGFYWLTYTLGEFAGLPFVVCILIAGLLMMYHALQIVLSAWLWLRLRKRGTNLVLASVLTFVVGEFVFPLLFPMYYGSTLQDIPPLMQIADLGGPVLVGALVMLVNATIYTGIKSLKSKQPLPIKTFAATLICVASVFGYGTYRIADVEQKMAKAEKVTVGLVQANMDIFGKRNDPEEGWKRHLQLSMQLEKQGVDLIVWPESGYAWAIPEHVKNVKRYVLGPLSTPVLFGAIAIRGPEAFQRHYNTAFLSDGDGKLLGTYDKTFLLAFAEYMPFAEMMPWLYDLSPNSGHFNPGNHVRALPFNKHRIGTLICYEDILPDFVRNMVKQSNPDLLINITNDAWFGDTIEPWGHLALAKFRAIEHHRYLVRSTNSGVSAIIDPLGRIVKQTKTFEKTTLKGDATWLKGHTTFEALGQWPGWLSLILVVFLGWFRSKP